MAGMDELTGRTAQVTLDQSAAASDTVDIRSFNRVTSSHLERIYSSLAASSRGKFLDDTQKETHAYSGPSKPEDHLESLDAFQAYMASPASSALQPAQEQDLSAPITDYFISSSHNTYLTGNQLYSDAAADAYTNALRSGCRCVEIDVWDGEPDSGSSDDVASSSSSDTEKKKSSSGTKKEKKGRSRVGAASSKIRGFLRRRSSRRDEPAAKNEPSPVEPVSKLQSRPEPKVLHGHTLTKGATFREVCNAIRDSAFVVSDLPLIVSLEVHACLEQQETMVEIIMDAWKGLLIDISSDSEIREAPALEELKRKILIKVKWSPPPGEAAGPTDKPEEPTSQEQAAGESSSVLKEEAAVAPQKPAKILHALSKLAVHTKAYHFDHFEQPEATVPGHIFSLSENAAKNAHENSRDALFEHNRRHLMRIYPFGLRVNSSNLDPSYYWRRGAQIVALNWQNLDKGMMLNRSMFAGTQGWVRKPLGYRNSDASEPVRRNLDLSIEVFAAQSLPLPSGDTNAKGFRPYVISQLHAEQPDDSVEAAQGDDSSDSKASSYRRTTKSSAGTDPDFGGQPIQFPTVSGIVEELSFVRFKVKDDELGRDSLAAWACIKLNRLQEGYRLIHLHDCTGSKSGFLFVKISKSLS